MKRKWVYIFCWANGDLEAETREQRTKLLEYEAEYYEDGVVVPHSESYYHDGDNNGESEPILLCSNGVTRAFGLNSPLLPGQFIELQVMEP